MMQILNHSKSAGLLNIIEGTDPLITQFRYTFKGNTVIQNVKDKRIITVFSDMPKSPSHVKGYKKTW